MKELSPVAQIIYDGLPSNRHRKIADLVNNELGGMLYEELTRKYSKATNGLPFSTLTFAQDVEILCVWGLIEKCDTIAGLRLYWVADNEKQKRLREIAVDFIESIKRTEMLRESIFGEYKRLGQ